jgi:hypothetical protein
MPRKSGQFDLFDKETDVIMSQLSVPETQDNDLDDFKAEKPKRFAEPVSEKELIDIQESGKAKNTVKDTTWALKVFNDWKSERNMKAMKESGSSNSSQGKFVVGLNESVSKEDLNYWLSRFVVEVRKKDGGQYPAATLKHICSGLQRYLRETHNRHDVSFFDGPDFNDLRKTLDGRMKLLNRERVGGLHRKQAESLMPDDEQVLWEKEIFNDHSAFGLHNIMYFYTGKIFGLRAADEHRRLNVQDFTFGTDSQGEYVLYQGGTCKNHQGGLKQTARNTFKNLKQYACESNPRCYVGLLKKYLSFIPGDGPFYRRPLPGSYAGHIKFSQQAVGVHQFETLLQRLTKEAGLPGYYTGHSAKVNIYLIYITSCLGYVGTCGLCMYVS